MAYVCFVLNHVQNSTIENIPTNQATGSTCDVLPLLRFHFWQPIYFNSDGISFTSDSTEEVGQFVGSSDNVGHDVTFFILNTTANKGISRSKFRPVAEPISPNLRNDPLTAPEVVTSRHSPSDYLENNEQAPAVTEDEPPNDFNSSPKHDMPILDPKDLVGGDFSYSTRIWSTSTS